MNTKEFIEFYTIKNQCENMAEGREKIEKFLFSLSSALRDEKKVIFRKFGSFEVRKTKRTHINNPKNPEEILQIKEKKSHVKFKSSRLLDDMLCDNVKYKT